MLVAISGGAGFLGLHLARRLIADGHVVRTLDVAPLDDAGLEGRVEELRGDVRIGRARDASSRAPTCSSTRRRRCRSRRSRDAIRSVNVDGAAVTFAAALEAGVRPRGADLLDRRLRRARSATRIHEDAPLVGVGHYGESKIEAERRRAPSPGGASRS